MSFEKFEIFFLLKSKFWNTFTVRMKGHLIEILIITFYFTKSNCLNQRLISILNTMRDDDWKSHWASASSLRLNVNSHRKLDLRGQCSGSVSSVSGRVPWTVTYRVFTARTPLWSVIGTTLDHLPTHSIKSLAHNAKCTHKRQTLVWWGIILGCERT